MVLDFFRSQQNPMQDVEAKMVAMMRDSRVVFDASMGAVFGGGKSKQTRQEVRRTDRGINIAQQEVRRALMMHASISDAIDLPLVLSYMSVVKDIERVGDYAKNIYDLARYGHDFSSAEDLEDLERYREAVGQLIEEVAETFESRDSDRAQRLIGKADGFLEEYDARIKKAYRSKGEAADAVARALYYRFLKRITAHCMNLLTSMVQPIDMLDYYDEDPEDRVPRSETPPH